MNIDDAKRIISHLADGINPQTGEVFAPNSPYQHPDTVRALYKALMALERWAKYEKRQKSLPPNAGKAWSSDEEEELIASFDRGMSLSDLAKKHGRTVTAIRSRLEKLGKIDFSQSMSSAVQKE